MNKKVTGLIFLLSVLAACAPAPQPAPPPPPPAQVVCQAGPPAAPCNPSQPAHITINPGRVSAAPPRFCAEPGDTVVFKVAGNPAKSSVGTAPGLQNVSAIWLIASNDANATEFSLQVPQDAAPGDYKYMVFFGNGSCLDPMIEVTR